MVSFILDVIIIGIVIFCVWRGYKNGLIRGVFGVVALITALLVANVTAQAYSKEAESIIYPFAAGIIDSTLMEMAENDIYYQPLAHDHDRSDPAFGEAYMALREIGLPEGAAVALAGQTADDPFINTARPQVFVDTLAQKLTSSLSYIAVFAIVFLVLAIVFAVIGNLFGFIFSLPGLRLLDTISGSIFGLVKGVILVIALSMIIRYYGILARDTVEATNLLDFLMRTNPIANIFGY